jgi:hypothetical protein
MILIGRSEWQEGTKVLPQHLCYVEVKVSQIQMLRQLRVLFGVLLEGALTSTLHGLMAWTKSKMQTLDIQDMVFPLQPSPEPPRRPSAGLKT